MSEQTHKTVIAVDGPAASGKGTFAKALADRLGYAYLDTGSLYRIVAWATLERGGDPTKLEDVKTSLPLIKFPLGPEVLKNEDLRRPEVDEAVPKVSAIPEVRAIIRAYQAAFMKDPPGNAPGVVLDGRDIGSTIAPNADVKFFVTADAEERARRRFEQQKDSNPGLTKEMVLKDINLRDEQDRRQAALALHPASDVCVLDTTKAKPDETLEQGLRIVKAKLSVNDNSSGNSSVNKKKIAPKPPGFRL